MKAEDIRMEEEEVRELAKAYIAAVDERWAYRLAKKMEEIRSNPVLGYRTAGSQAELATGEMLRAEMEALGLSDIHKDRLDLDGWSFERAVLSFTDAEGVQHTFQLGAYQTQFVTEGAQRFPLVYAGRGTAADYEGLDVSGCLVLVEINQRDEWWINYPVYQAHLKGAAAVIAVQDNGYGEINDEALNAQDIAGPKDAPAFSMSRADAAWLFAALKEQPCIEVELDARSEVWAHGEAYNVWGCIEGETDDLILLSAHYDSYFSGFQDDNCAVAMMLGIARTLKQLHYRPKKTLVFCALAAEEWGVSDSKYDWSTGAWQQVFCVRPEWRGKVIIDLNFELPAHAQGRWDGIRSTYEYADFIEDFVRHCPLDVRALYPEGFFVQTPIETWSDDFSMAIGGIPSTVNAFSSAEFMETHYHSQFDNEDYYDAAVYRFHHQFYGLLLLAFDRTRVAPLNIRRTFQALRESLTPFPADGNRAYLQQLLSQLDEVQALADKVYAQVKRLNADSGERGAQDMEQAACEMEQSGAKKELHVEKENGSAAAADKYESYEEEAVQALQTTLLWLFQKCQDYFVRLNWHDEVLFPHEAARSNLDCLGAAVEKLEQGEIEAALAKLYMVDNNQYAFQFDDAVYRHFTDYVLHQDRARLQWGAGRIVHHLDISHEVRSLLKKKEQAQADVSEELAVLKCMQAEALKSFDDDLRYLMQAITPLTEAMQKLEGSIF